MKKNIRLAVFWMLLAGSGQILAFTRPNVIVIMTDDQGYGDLSCHGNPILKTPNMDVLHSQSVRLTDYHVAPMCTPSRGQFLTGCDACRNNAVNVSSGRSLLRADVPTIADFFAKAGYATAIFGKWHVGDNYPYRPQDRGFEEVLTFPSSHIGSVPDQWNNDYFDDTYLHNGHRESYQGYCTDVFFREAMSWIDCQQIQGKPFFLYLPTNAPHAPHWAKKEDRERIEKAIVGQPSLNVSPSLLKELVPFLAMIQNIDANIGKLDRFLEKNGLKENTILVFTSDNGSTLGHAYYPAGMRGRKTELWEGGHRVPLFIRWLNGNLNAPCDLDGLAEAQDLLPTLLDLCGIETTAEFDGISLASALRGQADLPEDRMLVIDYSRMPWADYPMPDACSHVTREGACVLWKRWRLIEDRILNNLDSDPLQQRNVINEYPETALAMRNHLDAWWKTVQETVNIPQPVTIGADNENPTLLSACEWVDVFVDQQKQVRAGVRKNSYWELMVSQSGKYEFELRRWPRESGLGLCDEAPELAVADGLGVLPKGQSLPVAFSRLQIGDSSRWKKVEQNGDCVRFSMDLNAGPARLYTWFYDDQRQPLCGAYYVYVTRLVAGKNIDRKSL